MPTAQFPLDHPPGPRAEEASRRLDELQAKLAQTEAALAASLGQLRAAQARDLARERTMTLVATGAPLHEVLSCIVRGLQDEAPERLCSVLLLDGDRLRIGAAPDLPADYTAAIDGITVGPHADACALAAWRGEPVVCEDLLTDTGRGPWHEAAVRAGLRACWSQPIFANGRVVATFAIHHRQPARPLPHDDDALADATRLVALALESDRARARLELTDRRYRFLMDHMLAGVLVVDRDGAVLQCNAYAYARLGQPGPVMAGHGGMRIPPLLAEDGRRLPLQHYPSQEVATSGRPVLGRVVGLQREGEAVLWLLVNAVPDLGEGGEIRQIVVSFVDISERRQAELTLAESEQRYRLLYDNSLDGVLQTLPGGSILSANRAACAIFGCSDPQVLQACSRDQVIDLSDPRLPVLLTERRRAGHCRGQVRMRRVDGSLFEAEVASSLYRDQDGRQMASVVVRDISEQVAAQQARATLERQLHESQKMEAVGTLAGGIAHDFNNILGGILGHVALARQALEEDGGQGGREVAGHLGLIQRAGLRARHLVQQILAFGRRQPQQRTAQPLGPVVADTLALLRATLPAGVELRPALSPAPLTVAMDPTQIQQVLMNLCTNGWHALQGRPGRVEVGLAPLQPAGASGTDWNAGLMDGEWAHLWVTDDGVGMDRETRNRVFEPFFTTKPVGEGTGLGLAVVHGIVAAHGGLVAVDSTPGGGTTFHVALPLTQQPVATDGTPPPDEALPPLSPQDLRGRGQRVLYVDDDEVMLVMVERLLQRLGYQPSCWPGPEPALAALRARPAAFDALVTDYNMPGLSGMQVVRTARALRPDLPVVLTSGAMTDTLTAEAHRQGVHALLRKEHTLEDLGPVLHQVLQAAR